MNPDGTANFSNYLSLNENDQANYLLAGKTHVHSELSVSTGGDLTSETLHKYLGYATVLLAGLTAVSGSDKDVHYAAAYGTVAASVGTLTTGYLAHGYRFSFEDGFFTEDNSHIIIGTLGALGCIAAVALADANGGNSHDKIGIVGGSAMLLSIITIKW